MPVNLGLALVDKAYLGLAPIDRIYFGNSLLWQAEEEEPSLTLKAGTLTNPPVSARLGIISSAGPRPFTNQFKIGWGWTEDGGGYRGMDWLIAQGHVTRGGNIVSLPPGASLLYRMLEHMAPNQGGSGRWRLRWLGGTDVEVKWGGNQDQTGPREVWFDYTANGGSDVAVAVHSLTGGAPHSFSLVHEDDIADFDAGKIYRRQYLDEVRNYRCLRFDEWTGILQEEPRGLMVTDWASRPLPSDEIFYRFVPLEWQCALCNEVGADGWFCMPTAATDDYIEGAATLIRSHMPAPRRVYAELSTKTWDFAGTPQAHYFANEGAAYYDRDTGQEFLDFYGMQSAICAQIWREV